MAGLEVVVRPVVLPNIRPAPARVLPPADDPEKGFCLIKGNGGHHVDLTYSHSMSVSRSKSVEKERRVDEVRVYQEEDDGTINRDNFVDLEVANRIKSEGGKAPAVDDGGGGGTGTAEGGGGSGTAEGGGSTGPGQGGGHQPEDTVQYYKPVEEADNIEVRKKNVIKKSSDNG